MFNLEQFLIKNKIEYRTSGKNVSKGEFSICCVFCGEGGYHLGINPTKKLWHCWICGGKGNYEKLISKILNISHIEAKEIINPISDLKKVLEDRKNKVPIIEKSKEIKEMHLPEHTYKFDKNKTNLWQEIALKFLKEKYNLTWEHILEADLHFCIYGRYKHSIIIPFYLDGKLVNFISRAWNKNAKKRYDNCPNELSIVNIKSMVYNIDNVKNRKNLLIIVEGCFDAIKSGLDRTIALCGTEVSKEQLSILANLGVENLIIMLDNDPHLTTTSKKAQALADYLSLFSKTRVIKLPYGKDPGSMERKEMDELLI